MTIDEAIVKCKEITNTDANCPAHCNISCDKCVQESLQLTEWLEELKFLRQWKSDVMDEFCKYDCNSVKEAMHNGYNKAIDDFVEELIRYVDCDHLCSPTYVRWSDLSVVEMVNKLAEQLKAGGKNE